MRVGRDTVFYQDVEENRKYVLDGTMLSIDPSCGSTKSMPGYAVYRSGILLDSGIIELPLNRELPERLQRLVYSLRKLYGKWEPDVVVYEDVAPTHFGGGGFSNAAAHSSLLKSIGALLSVSGPHGYIRLKPMVWKKLVRGSYVKGDKEDAEEMGWITAELARFQASQK